MSKKYIKFQIIRDRILLNLANLYVIAFCIQNTATAYMLMDMNRITAIFSIGSLLIYYGLFSFMNWFNLKIQTSILIKFGALLNYDKINELLEYMHDGKTINGGSQQNTKN